MIPQSDLNALPLVDMAIGEQRKFDHVECPAGVDHKGRLYILRKEARLWLAYCHNCGEGGAVSTNKRGSIWETPTNVLKSLEKHYAEAPLVEDAMTLVSKRAKLPADCTYITEAWDAWAHERLWSAFTTASIVSQPPYEWAFSPSLNQLITPIMGVDGGVVLQGYQARCSPNRKPKCITTYFEGFKGAPLFYKGKAGAPLFIVEDPLSALRIHNVRSNNVMALLGTHMGDVAMAVLLRVINWYGIGQVVIWMDNDDAGKKASHQVFNRVRQTFNPHFGVGVLTLPEAKTFNDIDLEGLVI